MARQAAVEAALSETTDDGTDAEAFARATEAVAVSLLCHPQRQLGEGGPNSYGATADLADAPDAADYLRPPRSSLPLDIQVQLQQDQHAAF